MKYLSFLLLLLTVSCSNTEKKTAVGTTATANVLRKEIVNIEYANMPLGQFDFSEKELADYFKGEYKVDKTPVENKYTGAIDTLISFKSRKSIARFYKNSEKIFLDSLNVSDRGFVRMRNNFDIGMGKDDFLSHFKIKNGSYGDSIVITNEENNSVSFLFSNNKLYKIAIMPW